MSLPKGLSPLPICPYWRRFTVEGGNRILALCGAESPEQAPLPDTDIGERLTECPWWGQHYAYIAPSIVELGGIDGVAISFGIIFTGEPGIRGIRKLEALWEEAVKEFHRRGIERPV